MNQEKLSELKERLFELNQERRRIKREIRKIEPKKVSKHEKTIVVLTYIAIFFIMASFVLMIIKLIGGLF